MCIIIVKHTKAQRLVVLFAFIMPQGDIMINKWLIKALKRRFSKMSVDEQNAVRELGENRPMPIDEPKSETKHKSKKSKRRIKTMADEKDVEKKVETSKVDDKTESNEVGKEKSTDKVEKTEEKVDETKKVEDETPKDKTADDDEPTAPQVQDTETQGNGVDINDLVTKEMLTEALKSMEAKFDAVVKENQDLKDKLSQSKQDADDLREKYENKDFGNFNKQGMIAKDKQANATFDEYSKQFM